MTGSAVSNTTVTAIAPRQKDRVRSRIQCTISYCDVADQQRVVCERDVAAGRRYPITLG